MMNFNEWQLIKESLAGGMTLGLSQPSIVGGLIGSQFNEEDDEDNDGDEENGSFGKHKDDDDDDSFGDEDGGDGDNDADDQGGDDLEGDLFGSSKDAGPKKSFPPDDSEDMDGLPTPDEEMAGKGDAGDAGADDGDGDELADLIGGKSDGPLGAPKGSAAGGKTPDSGDDMDFLGDIDPELLGDKGGDDAGAGLDADAGADSGAGEPCPDCNPDGSHEVGEDGCPTCDGVGFIDNDDMGGHAHSHHHHGGESGEHIDPEHHKDSLALMKMMHAYMGKYMQKESVTPVAPAAKASPVKAPKMMKKFMKKDCDHDVKHCTCESVDFLTSLSSQAKGEVYTKYGTGLEGINHNQKYDSGLYEDALFDPKSNQDEEPQAGQVGFAPNGRIGSIGGGYTMDDMKDIPVLGESSKRYPTLTEWQRYKSRKK